MRHTFTSSDLLLFVVALCGWAACGGMGCGGGLATTEAPVRSAFRDPPTPLARAGATAEASGVPSGLITGAGRDQAHDLLIELVLALVSEDEARLGTLIAERVLSAAPHADGTPPHTGMDRSALVRHMLAAVRAARLPEAPHVSSLLESAIEIEPASSVYPSDLVPTGVAPTDLVVRFRVRPEGRRALAGLAPSGSGLLVVRPGPSPQLIAR